MGLHSTSTDEVGGADYICIYTVTNTELIDLTIVNLQTRF